MGRAACRARQDRPMPRLVWCLLWQAAAEVYLRESFDDESWEKRWIVPRNFPPKDEAVRAR